jgi:putative endonuclease
MRRDTEPGARHALAMSKHPTSKAELGAAAENCAAEFLGARGVIILDRNLRCKAGELDLVCLDAEILVIVEVRQRSRRDYGGAAASVTPGKQRKLLRATRFFWQRRPDWRTRIVRFDVIALRTAAGGIEPEIDWIKDAFRASR